MIDQETLGASLAYTNKALEALKNVVHYLGVTTTTLSDGATTNPITIGDKSVTAVNGDMVFYNGTAYTWDGTEWQETLSIAQIITQIETITEEIGNLSNLTTEEKSNLVGAINEVKDDMPTALSDLTDDATHRLVTDTEKSTWNGKADTADITNAISALDVSSVGGTGKYISEISEADGKINATAGTMDDVPTENSNAPVKSGGIKTAIDNSVSLKTATGNPITLTDAVNANAEELLMTIEPIQSGSGDPSPTNVRPISGISTASVQTTDGTDTNTASITLGQTVYGGSVNFKTGEVTVTHGMVDLGDYDYGIAEGLFTMLHRDISDAKTPTAQGIESAFCSAYKHYYTGEKISLSEIPDKSFVLCVQAMSFSRKIVVIKDSSYTDATAFKTAMSGVQLCYELETPITLTLTPAELELLKGNNTITANGAEISIEYYPDNAIGTLAERVDDVQEQITTKANTADVNVALAEKADVTTVTIPRFIPSQAGWRRICKIKPISGMSTVDAMVYIGGAWTNGQPPSASLAVSIMGSSTSLTLLSSAIGDSNKMTDIRLVSASSGVYWVDVYFPAYSSNTGIFKLTFTGDIAVSDIQNPISITTDATAASAEISLNQNVSGTVLTDKSSMIANLFKKGISLSASGENTIVSTRDYDTICIVGGFGSSVVFDVIFVNNAPGVLKLGHSGGVITGIDKYSVKYKAYSEFAYIKAFSMNNETLSNSVNN